MSTNPVNTGVEDSSISSAAARLLGPQPEVEQPDESEPEQESPEVETPEAVNSQPDSEEADGSETEASVEDSEVEFPEEDGKPEQAVEEPQEDYHTIKYDGQDYEVTLEELKKGYQLQKDYTQKTQSLSEERSQVDALKAELEQERVKYLEINGAMPQEQQSELQQFDNIDWKTLKSTDPMEYISKMAEKQELERSYESKRQLLAQSLTQQQEKINSELNDHIAQQAEELKRIIPEFADPVEGQRLKASISEYAVSSGYSDEEISNVVNARDLVVLNKARLWDEMQNKKVGIREKKAAEKPSIRVKSSSPQGKLSKDRKVIEAVKQKARSSGKKEDAAAALLALMQS